MLEDPLPERAEREPKVLAESDRGQASASGQLVDVGSGDTEDPCDFLRPEELIFSRRFVSVVADGSCCVGHPSR